MRAPTWILHAYEFQGGRCRNLRFLPEFEAEPQIVLAQKLDDCPALRYYNKVMALPIREDTRTVAREKSRIPA